METRNPLVDTQSANRSSNLVVAGTVVFATLLFASTSVFAYDFFSFAGTTLVADAEKLLKEAGTIAVGIGMAAVAFFIGVSALKWLRGAA